NVKFIRLTVRTDLKTDMKIYKNSKYDKKQISTTLRSLPNGVRDEIVKRGNRYYKIVRCGEYVLTGGSVTSANNFDINTNTIITSLNVSNLNPRTSNITGYCNEMKFEQKWGGDYEHIYVETNKVALHIAKSKIVTHTFEGLKDRLNSNPITVVYELAIHQIIEIPNPNLRILEGASGILNPTGNLLENILYESGRINYGVDSSGNNEVEPRAYRTKDFVGINPNKKYKIYTNKINGGYISKPYYYFYYTENKTFIARDDKEILSPPTNARYIRFYEQFSTDITQNIGDKIKCMMFELEYAPPFNENMAYIPPSYTEYKTTFLLNTGVVQCEASFEVTNSLGSTLDVLANNVSDVMSNVSILSNLKSLSDEGFVNACYNCNDIYYKNIEVYANGQECANTPNSIFNGYVKNITHGWGWAIQEGNDCFNSKKKFARELLNGTWQPWREL
ncbi:MAG: hypothetical protein ACRCX2_10390, partial [Paraclostridium sp.]